MKKKSLFYLITLFFFAFNAYPFTFHIPDHSKINLHNMTFSLSGVHSLSNITIRASFYTTNNFLSPKSYDLKLNRIRIQYSHCLFNEVEAHGHLKFLSEHLIFFTWVGRYSQVRGLLAAKNSKKRSYLYWQYDLPALKKNNPCVIPAHITPIPITWHTHPTMSFSIF